MTCDLFIKSHPPDFEFLRFCLRSIQKYATGFRQTVVVTSHGVSPPTGTHEEVFYIREQGDGYKFQEVIKLNADYFTDAEFILFDDSDTVFTRPISPADVIVDGRPVWYYTPYSSLSEKDQVWKESTEAAIGCTVRNELMRKHPFCVHRSMLSDLRRFFWKKHGKSVESYIMQLPTRDFSEFNVLGAYLWAFQHDKVEWRNTDTRLDAPFVEQHWSHGGLNDELRGRIAAQLA